MTQAEFIKMVQDGTTNFVWIMVLFIIGLGVWLCHEVNKDDVNDERKDAEDGKHEPDRKGASGN